MVVGGELTMDNLELRHDPRSNINEAPLQMKSNCGCLLIDDFGRQRIEPAQLLNRWIVPLEMRHDFLTLADRQEAAGAVRPIGDLFNELKPATWSTRPSCGAFLTRSRSPIRAKKSSIVCSRSMPRHSAATIAARRSMTCSSAITGRRNAGCAAASRAICCCKSAAIAPTPGSRWKCAAEYFDRAVKTYFATVLGEE